MQNSMNVTREERLEAAGNAVFRQLAEDPDLVHGRF